MKLDAIGVLFAKSWKKYEERFGVLVSIFAFPLVIIGIGQLLVAQQMFPAIALGGIINLIGIIVSIAASVAMIAALGKNENFAGSYQTGFKLFWSSLWISILVALAVFGGFVILIIPGIMLAVQLGFAQYALVLEDKQGITALAQSREYIKGYWWAFVGRALLLSLGYLVVMLILYLPFKILLGGVLAALIYGILLLLLTPFSVIYSYEIFENLRRLKPGLADAPAKTDNSFLKVCMVLGILGFSGFIIAIFALGAILPAAISRWSAAHPHGYEYSYPPVTGTSTTSGTVSDIPSASGTTSAY